MELNKPDEIRKKNLDNQIKKGNLDMNILNGISGKTTTLNAVPGQKTRNFNMSELAQILKHKNLKFSYDQSEKNQTQEWLKSKGVNIKKMQEQIIESARISAELGAFSEPKQASSGPTEVQTAKEKLQGVSSQKQSQKTFTKNSQIDFVNKQKQISINRAFLNKMKQPTSKIGSSFRNHLIEKLKDCMGSNDQMMQQQIPENQLFQGQSKTRQKYENEETRRQKYFAFVEKNHEYNFKECLPLLQSIRPFWKIVLQHIEAIKDYENLTEGKEFPINQKQRIMCERFMFRSLKLIESKFSNNLHDTSISFTKLDEIIKDYERKNRNLKIWRNPNGEPSWARAFFLLRAGRINDIKRALQNVDRQFLKELLAHERSLENNPTPSFLSFNPSKYNDHFYKQLLRILKGQQIFEPQIIKQTESLTQTWIILRVIGIYRGNSENDAGYQKITYSKAVSDVQSKVVMTSAKIEEYFYLGMYNHLINMYELVLDRQIEKKIEGFDSNDFFHLILVLHKIPELLARPGDDFEGIKAGILKKFALEHLVNYLQRLRNEGFNHQTVNYLMVCPLDYLKKVARRFIRTRPRYEEFDWNSFKKIFKKQDPKVSDIEHLKISFYVLQKIELTTFEDYFEVAQLCKKKYAKFDQKASSFLQQKCYVNLLLKYLFYVQKKRYLLKNQLPSEEFTYEIFNFFGITLEMANSEVELHQVDQEAKKIVKECQFQLQKLINFKEKSEDYVDKIIRPFLFYQSVNQLAMLLENPGESRSKLKQYDPSKTYKQIPALNQLSGMKNNSMHNSKVLVQFENHPYQTIYPLYTFYLDMLIQRKRILCEYECNYSGLTDYLDGVLNNMKELENDDKFYIEKKIKKQQEEDEQQARFSGKGIGTCQEYRNLKREIVGYLREQGAYFEENWREFDKDHYEENSKIYV